MEIKLSSFIKLAANLFPNRWFSILIDNLRLILAGRVVKLFLKQLHTYNNNYRNNFFPFL